jgi:hypothetical protein
MTGMETFKQRESGTNPSGLEPRYGESLADRITTIAAMIGAVCGAIAGMASGSMATSDDPSAGGTLGTMLGALLGAVAGRTVIFPLWTALFIHGANAERKFADQRSPVGSSSHRV